MFLLRHTGNDKDFLATRVSYLLDLKGPERQRADRLLDVAGGRPRGRQSLLVGRVRHGARGRRHASSCRTARATGTRKARSSRPTATAAPSTTARPGTVFGSGAGVVVLRRLEDALRDGDNIYAVIRGSAVNNDGSRKAGYLAPSVDGQARAAVRRWPSPVAAETTISVKGETINAWYSGKHRAPGGNVQAVIRPDGLPIWVSDVAPGHLHDLTVARDAGVIGALNWSASQLDLPALADSGYDGAGQGVKVPVKQPVGGQVLAPDSQAYNTLLRSIRCLGERGFALLTGRWRALQRVTVSPHRIGELAQAALVLTRIENVQLRTSC